MRSTPAMISRQGVFVARIVPGVADVPMSVTRFVSLEVVEGLCPTGRHRSMVAVMGIKAVVNMAVKVGRAVKPGAGSDE